MANKPTYTEDLDARDDENLEEALAKACDAVGLSHHYIDHLRDAVDFAVGTAMEEGGE